MDFPDLGLNTHPVSAQEAWLGVTGAGGTPGDTSLSRVKPVRGPQQGETGQGLSRSYLGES